MNVTLESTIAVVSGLASTGAVGYIWRASIRLEVLEKLFNEKKTTIDTVKTNQDSMDKRLTRVEDAIAGLNEVIPEIRKLGRFTDKMETLFEVREAEIKQLQEAVFDKKDK